MAERSDFTDLLPDLSADDYERLKADIAARGVQIPWEVDEDGALLDGKHRQRAVRELEAERGVTVPHPAPVVRRGLSESEKRLHAVSLNLNRRQLTDAQKVLLGRTIKPDVEQAARERMAEASRVGKLSKASEATTTRDEIADRVGLGTGRTDENHAKIVEWAEAEAPELVEQAVRGEVDMRDLNAEKRKREQEAKRQEKRERTAELAAVEVPQTDRLYPVVYADPPWRYDNATPNREVENHYPTMTLDDIAAMDVPAGDDAVLFMWTTSPKLRDAFTVLDGWGFDYVTCMVWVKDRIGMGYYARQRHELLFIAKRGSLPTPEPSDRPDSVIEAPRGQHSAKPPEVYDMIDRMYPGLPKIEMFARSEHDGWDAWGNEA